MVRLAGLARLEHEADPAARARPHEVVVDGAHGEQGGDRRVGLGVAAIGQDDLVVALGDRLGRRTPEVLDRPPQPCAVVRDLEQDRQRDRPEAVGRRAAVEGPDLLQLRVRDHR